MNPISGRKDVTSLLAGLFKKFYANVKIETGCVNHQPALFYYEDDQLVTCQILALEGIIKTDIFFIRNPDKLRTLQKIF